MGLDAEWHGDQRERCMRHVAVPARVREGEVREGNGTRMVFPGHHRRRAANEGYEICVGAASHMPGGQAQPCLL